MFGGIGFAEVLFLGVIAILIWGKDLPAVARKVGAFYVRMRRSLNDMQAEIAREIPPEVMDVQEDLKEAVSGESDPEDDEEVSDEEDSEDPDEPDEPDEPTSDESSKPPDSPAESGPAAGKEEAAD